MAPALVAVGTYALLLAWNEYLYQFLLLSSKSNMTVPVALAQFLSSDQSPNYMMATASSTRHRGCDLLRVPPARDRRDDDGGAKG
jgi:ABC-type glycerol-3-phosphate transport system permease component